MDGDRGETLAGHHVDDPAGDGHKSLRRDFDRDGRAWADLDVLDALAINGRILVDVEFDEVTARRQVSPRGTSHPQPPGPTCGTRL